MYVNNAEAFVEASTTGWRLVIALRSLVMHHSLHLRDAFQSTSPLEAEIRQMFASELEKAAAEFDQMGARATRDATRQVIKFMDQDLLVRDADHAIQSIRSTFHDEMRTWRVMFLNDKDALLFDEGPLSEFGPEVLSAFPSAHHDMDEACKCLALERWDACAYHCAGVAEVGIKALCRELAVQIDLDARDTTWSKMSDSIGRQITAKGQNPAPRKVSHPATWPEDEQFFNGCLIDVSALRVAHRNPTMHFRRVVPANKASARADTERVVRATETFMRHLATKVVETP